MKIKSLIYLSNDRPIPLEFEKPLCFLRGQEANALMDQMREMIAEQHHKPRKGFLLRGNVEVDKKDYEVVCLCTDKDKHPRIVANLGKTRKAIQRDTEKYLRKCQKPFPSCENVLVGSASVEDKRDRRPLFIYNYFDRLDESADITDILDRLARLDRQVFIGVCSNYPDVHHKSVQMCTLDYGTQHFLGKNDVYNDTETTACENFAEKLICSEEYKKQGYQIVDCPVCGQKTLDMYWICPKCGWEYDTSAEDDYSSANGKTLREYRMAYFKDAQK